MGNAQSSIRLQQVVSQADAIAEITSGAGVTIDGTLIKDTVVYGRTPCGALSASGAVPLTAYNKNYIITKAGVAALTIANPTSGDHDGVELTFISATASAHTIDNSAGAGFNNQGSAKDIGTFGGAIGDKLVIVAYNGKWYVKDNLNVTLA